MGPRVLSWSLRGATIGKYICGLQFYLPLLILSFNLRGQAVGFTGQSCKWCIKLGMMRPRLLINSYCIVSGLVIPQYASCQATYYLSQFGLIMTSIMQLRTKEVEVKGIYDKRVDKQFVTSFMVLVVLCITV